MTFLLVILLAGALADRSVFVHRRACAGDGEHGPSDAIVCNEPDLEPIQHAITPHMLWCSDDSVCVTQFGEHYSLHKLECDGDSCTATLHCRSIMRDMQQSAALAVGSALVFLCCLPAALRACCKRRARNGPQARRNRHKDL